MRKDELLNHLREILTNYFDLCAKCGKCRIKCPIYEGYEREESTARAKISLVEGVLTGKIRPGHRFSEIVEKCTMCKGCVEVCPNDVRTDIVVIVGRFIARRNSLPLTIFNRWVLNSPSNMYRILKFLRPFQRFFLSDSRVRLPFVKRKYLPKISSSFFREGGVKRFIPRTEKLRVLYFPGCFLDFFFPEISWSVVEILTSLDVGVVVPDGWRCCGIPAIGFGDLLSAGRMAMENAEVIEREGVDFVITACGSCGATLKEHAPFLFGWKNEKIVNVGRKVMDVMEFIYKMDNGKERLLERTEGRGEKVFYHPSCHLKKGMGVHKEVTSILRGLKHIEFFEMDDRCCGFGGSFNIKHYEFSREINERRVKEIIDVKPDYLLTGSPGCQMHFTETLIEFNLHTKVTHPVVMINDLLKRG